GKDAIDHRPGAHDDVANAAAGALVHAGRSMAMATLPETFNACYRAASIAGFDPSSCYIFGGSFPGANDICCGGCVGHQYVRAAKKAEAARSGEPLSLVTFYRTRL